MKQKKNRYLSGQNLELARGFYFLTRCGRRRTPRNLMALFCCCHLLPKYSHVALFRLRVLRAFLCSAPFVKFYHFSAVVRAAEANEQFVNRPTVFARQTTPSRIDLPGHRARPNSNSQTTNLILLSTCDPRHPTNRKL